MRWLLPLVLLGCQQRSQAVLVTVEDPRMLAARANRLSVSGPGDDPEVRRIDGLPTSFVLTHFHPVRGSVVVTAQDGDEALARARVDVDFGSGEGVTVNLRALCTPGMSRTCDDGRYCNGPEQCSPDGFCTDAAPPCSGADNGCLVVECVESAKTCAIRTHPDLDDGEACSVDFCGPDGPIHVFLEEGSDCSLGGVLQSGFCENQTCVGRVCGADFEPCAYLPDPSRPGICLEGACVESSCGDARVDRRFEDCDQHGDASICAGCRLSADCELSIECGRDEITSITVGPQHSCVIADGEPWCWGNDEHGAVGAGLVLLELETPTFNRPIRVTQRRFVHLSAGSRHTCGVAEAGTLWCWGDLTTHGDQLRRLPVQIGADADWILVEAGERHTCAVKTDETVWCWGRNAGGELGLGDRVDRALPERLDGISVAEESRFCVGVDVSCASNGVEARCWGPADGPGLQASDAPAPVALRDPDSRLLCGRDFVCVESTRLESDCAGNAPVPANAEGVRAVGPDQACYGVRTRSLPSIVCSDRNGAISSGWSWVSPAQGDWSGRHACRLNSTPPRPSQRLQFRLDCWGANEWGQLGDGSYQARDVEVVDDTFQRLPMCCFDP